jgi:Flp pilus assembly protein TadB
VATDKEAPDRLRASSGDGALMRKLMAVAWGAGIVFLAVLAATESDLLRGKVMAFFVGTFVSRFLAGRLPSKKQSRSDNDRRGGSQPEDTRES